MELGSRMELNSLSWPSLMLLRKRGCSKNLDSLNLWLINLKWVPKIKVGSMLVGLRSYIYIYTLGNSVGGLTERGGCLALAYSQATRCFLLENIEHG